MSNGLFRFSIDRGGTFTDIYAEVPGNPGFRVVKLLSQDPDNYHDAPTEGIRRILSEFFPCEKDKPIDASRIEWIRMGTTVATNALLERKGTRCALLVTKGFGDILRIGTQERPHLFDLKGAKPGMLYDEVIEVDERLRLLCPGEEKQHAGYVQGVTGDYFAVLARPDPATLQPVLQDLLDRGITSLAVVFLHSYSYADHELMVGQLARRMGFSQVSLSSQVMPAVKLVSRGDTTVVDAYLTPHIRQYINSFRAGFAKRLRDTNLLFMQSHGGLAPDDAFTGSRAILSGPAGGVVGYAMTTFYEQGHRPVIGFDMGGTSTDVSRFGGEYDMTFETVTAGIRVQAPQLDIRTVAAGGGSRLFFENSMLKVGPESAGAHPGPVCYRKGGYPTITDANLVLGRLQPDYFPRIFGPDGEQPLDLDAARKSIAELAGKINSSWSSTGQPPLSVEETALGFIQVANEVMVRPIREVSVMRGFDIKEHVLAVFGGAGAQHACAIARKLGISTIFIHRFSGILSACGMGMAQVVVERQRPFAQELQTLPRSSLLGKLDILQREAEQELACRGFTRKEISSVRYLNMRYQGTDTPLMVKEPADGDFTRAFARQYKQEFGFDLQGRPVMVDDLRVRTSGMGTSLNKVTIPKARGPARKVSTCQCYFGQGWVETDLYMFQDLRAGHCISGPAIMIQDTSTVVVEPGCTAVLTRHGDVEIRVGERRSRGVGTSVDPVQLAIFSNLFMSIAEQMGSMLQKTAISTNIKERQDFSCALFSPDGSLVANAPHVPVHLGAMSDAVKEQVRRCPHIRPGDVLVSNHPAAGGSHLPDITVMTPVFHGDNIIFWVASRGHHADIGGISPGSMPPHSCTLAEEGVAILTFKLVEHGVFQEEGISRLLQASGISRQGRTVSGTRRLSDNISDLRAQVAANQKGMDLILEMVDRYGLDVVQAYMLHVQKAAEDAVRSGLRNLVGTTGAHKRKTVRATEFLDDGTPIALHLTIDHVKGSAVFDFTGTGKESPGNLNAPQAVTRSAVLYCLRCLAKKEIPLNQGCLLPVTLIIPQGSILDPSPHAAVVGGNVLTSQRIVDVVLKAFGVAAGSQGCMNNLTFGNAVFGYYETIGGGAGAGPGWHGQSGIHTHMTNTRITDPEILERRYPVMLREFAIRRGSGGEGRFRGGDGLLREVEFLAPVNVAILSERRVFPPYGLAGGKPGSRGRNIFIRADGQQIDLGGKNEIQAGNGDRIRILTPGGGGYGIKECPPE